MLKSFQSYFLPNVDSLDLSGKVYLEDFYDDEVNFGPFENLKILTLSISFDNGSEAENESLYMRAVQNLIKLAPNLQTVYFDGGYFYSPIENNSEVFRKELFELRSHFDSLSKIFNDQLPVASVSFCATQVFGQHSIDEAVYSQPIEELFGHKMSSQEIQNCSTSFVYKPAQIPFKIKLFFNVAGAQEDDQKSRSRRPFLDDRMYSNIETF